MSEKEQREQGHENTAAENKPDQENAPAQPAPKPEPRPGRKPGPSIDIAPGPSGTDVVATPPRRI